MLRELGAVHTVVDGPQGFANSVPMLAESTHSDYALVRLHGRNAITKHMLALSTYLGHAKVADTYWYLEAVPELMRDIAECTERFAMGGQL